MSEPPVKPIVHPGMFVLFMRLVWYFLGIAENGLAEISRGGIRRNMLVPLDQLQPIGGDLYPIARLRDFYDYPEHLKEIAKKRHAAIQPFLNAPSTKEKYQEVAAQLDVSMRTLLRMLDRYLLCGLRTSALIPHVFRFSVCNNNLSKDQRRILQDVIQNYYQKKQKPSQASTVRKVQKTCRDSGAKVISESTILRVLRSLSPSQVTLERNGKKAARDIYRAHRGKAPVGERPLALVEIDHTQTDVFVRLPSGKSYRPWITIAIDTFSRMVLGFYLTLESPCQLSVGMCLYRVLSSKTEWLLQHGITTSWPCIGRPSAVITDNAQEFRGYYLQEIGLDHNIVISFRGTGCTNWGSHVERMMGRLAAESHLLPGTSFSSVAERGDYRSQDETILTLEGLEKILLRFFVQVYHCGPHQGLGGCSPLSRWQEYYAQAGNTSEASVPQVRAGDELLISLLPYFRRTIQQDGVEWEALRYFDPALAPYVRAENPERADKLWRFHYDPRDIRWIYWIEPNTRQLVRIQLRDTSAAGMTLWDLLDQRKLDRSTAEATIDQLTIDCGVSAIEEIVASSKAISLKEHKGKKRTAKKKGLPPPTEVLEIVPPSLGPAVLLGQQPIECTDPSIWNDIKSFEVSPLLNPLSDPIGREKYVH